ncbi:RNA-binding motif, single-stranded-interacting protein 3 [Sciurus carolinensis]|uniref:RNA-binding motif, single-stranded-interacting protein 3 n=1 Tax=Sciurus carolinensis TaxID=30640 RepID=A0AA41MP55_SCICA|nr:RNA-binding motif, single-stranded-interacting protein 3 [Sciurus carolinensis]
MALTYDPTAAIQNGFYSSPYSIATNRMIPQTSITPFIAASPVSTYQYMTAAAPMQGTYIPQYTPVPPTAVSIEGVVADTSPQTVAPSSQDTSGQQQQIAVDTSNEHAPAYSYQQSNRSCFRIWVGSAQEETTLSALSRTELESVLRESDKDLGQEEKL